MRSARSVVVVLALVLAVAACGRKGPLEPPPGYTGPEDRPLAADILID